MIHDDAHVVGFILKGYPRLSETFILNEILHLERLGTRLHIFALRNPGESEVHERVRQVRARVTYIPDDFWRSFFSLTNANIRLWWNRPIVYWKTLKDAALRSIRKKNVSFLKRFFQAGYLVNKSLPGTNVGHFHAHFSHDPTTVAFYGSRLTGITYSFSAHAKDIYIQAREVLREKILHARFVVTCTEYNRNYLQEVGGPDAFVLKCYHGVDLKFFSLPATAKVRPPARPQILSIGRFVPKKGFSVLLQALQALRKKGYAFDCTIIGNGPLQGRLRTQISELALDRYVTLLPPLSQTELIDYYRSADIFALPCEVQRNGDRDGIPNVIVEAMAMGVPVVSTAISGIPEVIDHGMTGLLVPERNPRALAEAMATLLDGPEKAKELGLAGRKKVEHDFDAPRNIEEIHTALQQAMGPRRYEAGRLNNLQVDRSYSLTGTQS